tara:strand:- start:101 stop:325 length:225 start_codon:yes stop_codon:yes gene_type:complete
MEKKYECYLVGDKTNNGVWKELIYVLFTNKNNANEFINNAYPNKFFSLSGLKRTKDEWMKILKIGNVTILQGEK